MRHVLVVTSVFPPSAASAVHRVAKLTKLLPRCGWEPVVLHVPIAQAPRAEDQRLLMDVRPDLVVARVDSRPWEPAADLSARLLGKPALGAEWLQYRRALRVGLRLAREHDVRAILAMAPPKRLPVLGMWLHGATNLPLLTDFQDPPWPLEPQWRPRRLTRRFHEASIRSVFEQSAAIVANTEPVRQALVAGWGVPTTRAVCIPNGFDEEDFASLPDPEPAASRFTVVLGGPLVQGAETGHLLAGLELAAQDPQLRKRLRVRFLGAQKPKLRALIEASPLSDAFELPGHVPHGETIAELVDADLNLVCLTERHRKLRVPQKVYQCLRAGRPILAPIGDGPAQEILERSGIAHIVDPSKPVAIAEALVEAFRARHEHQRRVRVEGIERYERASLMFELAALLDATTSRERGA